MGSVRWATDARYPYTFPSSRRIMFWRCRKVDVRDPSRKTFHSITANRKSPGRYIDAFDGPPGEYGFNSRPCLFRLNPLRLALTPLSGGGVVLLTEGEKDAVTGSRMAGVRAATSHHGGACHFTPEQAEHLAPLATRRGRRDGPPALIVVDRDDPGYANALHTSEMLQGIGLRATVVRPADGVVANHGATGGGCGTDAPCPHDVVCPLPVRAWEKADLTDHANAGRTLRELTPVPEADLRAGAERWAVLQQQGASYGASPDSPFALTREERAWVRDSPWRRTGVSPWNYKKRSA